MKRGKNLHDEMLMDGTVHYGIRSDGVLIENGKPVVAAKVEDPIKPSVDVVARPAPKINAAPRVTDAPRKRTPEPYGLQRAIEANQAKGTRPARAVSSSVELTGLQKAINANIAKQKANQ